MNVCYLLRVVKVLAILLVLIRSTADDPPQIKRKYSMAIILQPSVKPQLNGHFSVFGPNQSPLNPFLVSTQKMIHTCRPEDPILPREKCDLLLIDALPHSGVIYVEYTPETGKPIQVILEYGENAVTFRSLDDIEQSTESSHFSYSYSALFTPSSIIDISDPADHITRFLFEPAVVRLVPAKSKPNVSKLMILECILMLLTEEKFDVIIAAILLVVVVVDKELGMKLIMGILLVAMNELQKQPVGLAHLQGLQMPGLQRSGVQMAYASSEGMKSVHARHVQMQRMQGVDVKLHTNTVRNVIRLIVVVGCVLMVMRAAMKACGRLTRSRAEITDAEHTPEELEVDSSDETLDVERHFFVLYTTLCKSVASEWEDFGRYLNVSQSSMECITTERMYYCFSEMIKKWLNQQEPPPTKSMILHVLKENLSLHKEADQLENKLSMDDCRKEIKDYGYKTASTIKSPYGNVSHVPFVGDIKVYECDEEGGQLLLDDIEVIIPRGAIPHGVTLLIEMGVALYGPFIFPNNSHPVSPILWFCTQDRIDFKQPMIFRFPHVVKNSGEKISFAKADHWKNFHSKNNSFLFKNISTENNESEFGESLCGYLASNHGCFLCIEENETSSQVQKNFCLHILTRKSEVDPFTLEIIVACTFFLDTCRRALEIMFPEDRYECEITREFQFGESNDEQPHLDIRPYIQTEENLQLTVVDRESKIFASEVDFWTHCSDKEQLFKNMKLKDRLKQYPPHIKIKVHSPTSQWATVLLKVKGMKARVRSVDEKIFEISKQFGSTTTSLLANQALQSEQRLSMKDFNTIFTTLCKSVSSEWDVFGSYLQLSPDSIEVIRSDMTRCRACLRQVILEWLKQRHPPPTKSKIMEALTELGFHEEADNLERKLSAIS